MTATAVDPFLDRSYARMQSELRLWALGFIALGAFHIAAGLQWLWPLPMGVVFVLMGLAGLYFREAAMYPVYAAVLLCAAISSILVTGRLCRRRPCHDLVVSEYAPAGQCVA